MARDRTYSLLVLGIVAVHSGVLGLHAAAHNVLGIQLTDFQMVFVAAAMIIVPAVAIMLVWTRFQIIGSWLLLGAIFASFIFGLFSHFILPGVDNTFIQSSPPLPAPTGPWLDLFQLTTVLLGITEIIGVAVPARTLLRDRHSAISDSRMSGS